MTRWIDSLKATNKLKMQLACLILVVAAPWTVYRSYQSAGYRAELERHGITVQGRVEGGSIEQFRKSSLYRLDVSYITADNVAARAFFVVSHSFFDQHISHGSVTDSSVHVRYLPGRLESASLVGAGFGTRTGVTWVLSGFMLIVGLLGLWSFRQ